MRGTEDTVVILELFLSDTFSQGSAWLLILCSLLSGASLSSPHFVALCDLATWREPSSSFGLHAG